MVLCSVGLWCGVVLGCGVLVVVWFCVLFGLVWCGVVCRTVLCCLEGQTYFRDA